MLHASLASRIKADPNYNQKIYTSSFNAWLTAVAKENKNALENICAIGPNPLEACFDLQGGQLFLIKYTYQVDGRVYLNDNLSCFITSDEKVLFYKNDLLTTITHLSRKNGFLDIAFSKRELNVLENSLSPLEGYSLDAFLSCPVIPNRADENHERHTEHHVKAFN